jgi:hypothetical protein
MPKKLLIFMTLAVTALAVSALAACGNNGDFTVAITPTPQPTASTASLLATYKSTPVPNVQINMYASTIDLSQTPNPSSSATPVPAPSPTGPILQTQITASDGTATFTGLNPLATYCWTFTYTTGGATLNAHNCTNGWPYGQVIVGT